MAKTIEDIAREQAELLGTDMLELMDSVLEAEEYYTLDELEEG